jgi:hypothetical protein
VSATWGEVALTRVLAYLRLHGIPLTGDVTVASLGLVQEAVAEGDLSEAVLAEVMDRLPRHFVLPGPIVPAAVPPLQRGSIHYGA